MKTVALIAVAAILVLTMGGFVYANGNNCCGKALPLDANAHGAGSCFGLCMAAAPAPTPTAGFFLLGWLFVISLWHPGLPRAIPIDKPPA